MLMRVLGPGGANRLTGCTVRRPPSPATPSPATTSATFAGSLLFAQVVTCFDAARLQRSGGQVPWIRMEAAMQSEGHALRVLHQPQPEAYAAWEAQIEQQLGFEIAASPASGLVDASGACHWLDYGPSSGSDAPATELSIRVWEMLKLEP